MWICVCGRFNKRAWRLCRRCQRHRDAVLTQYTKENTLAQYEAVKADLRAKELAQIEEEKQRAASLARQRKNTFLNQTHLLQTKRRNRFLLVLGTLLLCVGAMLLYLYLK